MPHVQRVAVTPLTLLAILEHARSTLCWAEVDAAIERLASARAAQNAVLDAEAQTPERPGTSIDLGAS